MAVSARVALVLYSYGHEVAMVPFAFPGAKVASVLYLGGH